MIAKITLSRSFRSAAEYCLHDQVKAGERRPSTDERVEWTDTRNLPTDRTNRAVAVMAATAEAAIDFKRLAGASLAGRKLAKPVAHLSLSWAKDETPDRAEMLRAVDGSLAALDLEGHQALIVAHNDTEHPHLHVLVNRVDPETGKAATLSSGRYRLSTWAQGWEEAHGKIRCWRRVDRNEQRTAALILRDRGEDGARLRRDSVSMPSPRWRREWLHPDREPRQRIPAGAPGAAREQVAWERAEELQHWARLQTQRAKWLAERSPRWRREWADLYGRQRDQHAQLTADRRGVRGLVGRLRRWSQGGRIRELGAAIAARPSVLEGWHVKLEKQHRTERAQLALAHHGQVRELERAAGETYRRGMEGSEQRAEQSARAHGPPGPYEPHVDVSRLRIDAGEEVLRQIREVDGEAAYQRRRRRLEEIREATRRLSEPGIRKRPPVEPERGGGIER